MIISFISDCLELNHQWEWIQITTIKWCILRLQRYCCYFVGKHNERICLPQSVNSSPFTNTKSTAPKIIQIARFLFIFERYYDLISHKILKLKFQPKIASFHNVNSSEESKITILLQQRRAQQWSSFGDQQSTNNAIWCYANGHIFLMAHDVCSICVRPYDYGSRCLTLCSVAEP